MFLSNSVFPSDCLSSFLNGAQLVVTKQRQQTPQKLRVQDLSDAVKGVGRNGMVNEPGGVLMVWTRRGKDSSVPWSVRLSGMGGRVSGSGKRSRLLIDARENVVGYGVRRVGGRRRQR